MKCVDRYELSKLSDYLEILFPKLRIAVVYGGNNEQEEAVLYNTHNPRSWKSYDVVARDIRETLTEIGFKHVFLFPDDINLAQKLKDNKIHMVWLNSGGVQGYNPICHTPSMMEMLGMPYIGHSPENTTILDNKHIFKQMLITLSGRQAKTAPFVLWNYMFGKLEPRKDIGFITTFSWYEGPFVVKPVSGRASLHVHKVDTLDELPEVVNEVSRITKNHVLIEKYLPGREFCVAVCGKVTYRNGKLKRNDNSFAFSALERVLDKGEYIFTSMDKKTITKDRARMISSEEEPKLKHSLCELGQKIYNGFCLSTLVRVDIRADDEGALHVLEVNPKPDLKKPTESMTSLVSVGLQEFDMTYNDLVLSLLADRLDFLMNNHPEHIAHIFNLINGD